MSSLRCFVVSSRLVAPGMLPVEPVYDLSLLDDVKALAADVVEGVLSQPSSKPTQDFNDWPSLQQQLFLQTLLDATEKSGPLPLAILDTLDTLYGLTAKRNSELRFKWCKLCLKSGRAQILRTVAEFLTTQGRMKFTRPLYRCLMETPAEGGRELAIGTFAANKTSYHPICRKMVASDLEKAMKKPDLKSPLSKKSEGFYAGVGFGIAVAISAMAAAVVISNKRNKPHLPAGVNLFH